MSDTPKVSLIDKGVSRSVPVAGEAAWWADDTAASDDERCTRSRRFGDRILRCERTTDHDGLCMASTDERNAMAWG